MFDVFNGKPPLAPLLVSDRRVRANIAVKEFVEKIALIILVRRLLTNSCRVAITSRCVASTRSMKCNARLNVKQSCHVVTIVPENVTSARREVHMNFANINAVDYWSVYIVATPHVANLALPVTRNVPRVVLTENVKDVVHSYVILALNRANGGVHIISARIFVGRSATALHVMLRVPRSSPVNIHVLACVEKTVQRCVPFAMPKSFPPQ